MDWKLPYGKLKLRFLLAIFCLSVKILHGLLSAQISPQMFGALLTVSLSRVSNHADNHSTDRGTDKLRFKAKAY